MKALVLTTLFSVCAVSLVAQVNFKLSMPSTQQERDALAAQAAEISERVANLRRVETALGALPITADRMELDASGKIVHASGNVTIRTNEVVVQADDAVIENGNVRLGANAHVVFAYPVKMIQ